MASLSSVEIIIPVYNDHRGVRNCLSALFMQEADVAGMGITVVDNGSSPPISIDEDSFGEVRVFQCDRPGSYAARNLGAKNTNADVLVFLDADCVPRAGWLSAGLELLAESDREVIVGGEVVFSESSSPTAIEAYQILTGFGQARNVSDRGFSATANIFVKRSVFEKIGQFNDALLSGGDREWCWRAGALGIPVVLAPAAVVETPARRELRGAIIQARRVAGGRHILESTNNMHYASRSLIKPEKGLIKKLLRICGYPRYAPAMKVKIILVAACLMAVRGAERVRLVLGGREERR